MGEHGESEVESDDVGVGVLIVEHAGKTAFATAGVECQFVIHVSEEARDQLDVVDTGIDGGREMFLIASGLFETLADFCQIGNGGSFGGLPPP